MTVAGAVEFGAICTLRGRNAKLTLRSWSVPVRLTATIVLPSLATRSVYVASGPPVITSGCASIFSAGAGCRSIRSSSQRDTWRWYGERTSTPRVYRPASGAGRSGMLMFICTAPDSPGRSLTTDGSQSKRLSPGSPTIEAP